MKNYIIIFFLFCISSCSGQKENLNFPTDTSEIVKVYLDKPDKKTHGKVALIQILTKTEIDTLIKTLNNAKVVGPVKYMPEYFIFFETKTIKSYGLKVSGHNIKGYDSDLTYKIDGLDFLDNFRKK